MARLLFVDDEPAMLFALQRLAEKLKHEPVLARSGAEALSKLEGVDAVITDYSMPEMDGVQLVQAIRERDESLPVIDAEFTRSGNSLSTVEERVVSSNDEVILSWWDLMKPFVLTMPPGAMNRPLGVYSTFLPARSAQLSVNGEAASAKPFPQERFGKPSSSCCLAWSESWTRPRS